MNAPLVLVLGPRQSALSGVSTHLRQLFGSGLAAQFRLEHFEVGSEGRGEGAPGRLLRFATSPLRLGLTILARGAGVVHINTSMNRACWRDLAYLLVARAWGARVLWQVHGGALPEDFSFRWILRRALRLADAVAVLTTEELQAYRRFLPGRQVVLLPNAIDCAPFAGMRETPEAPQPARLVFVGRLVRVKGLYELLQAVKLAVAADCNLRLAIAGTGEEEEKLKVFAAELGLERVVRFVGDLRGADKARLLLDSDVMMLPSHAEGLPYALLEGMAAGNAVIAARVGAMPDVVTHGVHGLLVPPRDPHALQLAILTLCADRERLRAIGMACRKRVADLYSLEQLAATLGRIYAGLCAGRQEDRHVRYRGLDRAGR